MSIDTKQNNNPQETKIMTLSCPRLLPKNPDVSTLQKRLPEGSLYP